MCRTYVPSFSRLQVRRPPKGRPLKPVAFASRKPTATDPAAKAAAAAGLSHPEFAYGLQLCGSRQGGKGRAAEGVCCLVVSCELMHGLQLCGSSRQDGKRRTAEGEWLV